MIGNFVTFPRSSRNDLRMFRDVFADHEEGCLNVMRRQQIENFGVSVALGPSSKVIAM